MFELKFLTSTFTGKYSILSNDAWLPYIVTLVWLDVIELIALPNWTSPSGITLIGTSLLGESILIVAFTLLGTISTSTTLPSVS